MKLDNWISKIDKENPAERIQQNVNKLSFKNQDLPYLNGKRRIYEPLCIRNDVYVANNVRHTSNFKSFDLNKLPDEKIVQYSPNNNANGNVICMTSSSKSKNKLINGIDLNKFPDELDDEYLNNFEDYGYPRIPILSDITAHSSSSIITNVKFARLSLNNQSMVSSFDLNKIPPVEIDVEEFGFSDGSISLSMDVLNLRTSFDLNKTPNEMDEEEFHYLEENDGITMVRGCY
ncbi:hypothetical protein LIER_28496 [Lithospermum erythrorhizon]|uniref:Uncharacterized protein n=1 Tax=Lithospermum erythrorhizon TaxID=34254 RepID=A0AAV3RHH5_LITER